MIIIREAALKDAGEIYELLFYFDKGYGSISNWRPFFEYSKQNNSIPGFILVVNGRIVGFLGTFFAHRIINEELIETCNLSSAIVRPGYRKYSMKLIRHALKLSRVHYIIYTPSNSALKIAKHFNFEVLDVAIICLLPIPIVYRKKKLKVMVDDQIDLKLLSDLEKRIYNDHRNYNCRQFLFYDGEEICLVVTTKIKKLIKFIHINFISNKKYFFDNVYRINCKILCNYGKFFSLIDERFLINNKSPLFSIKHLLKNPKMYRSNLSANKFDNLYSELVILPMFISK